MLSLMSDVISTKSDEGVLTLTLNRPTKMNALTRQMYGALANGLNEAAGDFSVRAVIISSEGDHFTAGNDIKDFMENPPTSDDTEVAKFLGSLLNFPKPLLAAVKGNAVGVGTTMLLHCDVVLASPTANFSMPFTSLGLVPEAGSSYLFPALVGYQRAARIFLTGETFSASDAKEMGLVTTIASDVYEQAQLMDFYETLGTQNPIGYTDVEIHKLRRIYDVVTAPKEEHSLKRDRKDFFRFFRTQHAESLAEHESDEPYHCPSLYKI